MGGNTLLVRHLPSSLMKEEKEDLLRHFGAIAVRVMDTKGPMVGISLVFSHLFIHDVILCIMFLTCSEVSCLVFLFSVRYYLPLLVWGNLAM